MADIPGRWPELRERERARLGDVTSELAFEADLVTGALQLETATLTAAFSGSAEYLARMFVSAGADHARRHAYLANDALPRLLAHGEAPARAAPAAAVSALSYVALMRCLSVPLPGTAAGVESRWLTIIAERPDLLNEPAIRTAALAAVAAGETGLVPKLV